MLQENENLLVIALTASLGWAALRSASAAREIVEAAQREEVS